MKTKTNIIYSAFALFAFACFAFAPQARAICQNGCDATNQNTFLGEDALISNTTGSLNTAIGGQALTKNTTGERNTATGNAALFKNTTGGDNTAIGDGALFSTTTGGDNTAIGESALFLNTGEQNTAIGSFALNQNTTGSRNIALGDFAGVSLTTGDDNIDIGNLGEAGDSNTTRIGNVQTSVFIAGIMGKTIPKGAPVFVNAIGQLGTVKSSARFKEAIKPMDKASEAILALKPVTFRYKKDVDTDRTPQFGLVAEDVAKVNPDLVVRDDKGEIYSVRYEAVNAMLLNEFIKEHRKVQELKSTVAQQQKDLQATAAHQRREFESKIAQQQKQIEALTSGLQRVSARLELNKSAPQTVLNGQ